MTNTKSINQSAPAVISPALEHVLDMVERFVVDAHGGHHVDQDRGQVRYSVNASERVYGCNSTSGELEGESGHIRGCWLVLEPGEEWPREVRE